MLREEEHALFFFFTMERTFFLSWRENIVALESIFTKSSVEW